MSVPVRLASAAPPAARWWRRRERDITLSVFLVLLLATTVIAWPLRDAGAEGLLFALRLATLAAGVAAVAPVRAHAIGAGIAALAVASAHVVTGERSPVLLGARLVFFALLGAALFVRVFGRGRVTVHRLLGAASLYVLLAVVWGTAYQLVVALRPDAILAGPAPASPDQAMWLSFVTITTTGYGDVLPVAPLARSLAALEAMVGVLYPAILISRLVSLVQTPAAADRDPGGASGAPPA